ncbi:cation diffusion facilitator family transporter [Desulfobaculum xiamenense]|uniref:Cation diffusion facilitator family transporter n=1 Tax=Desulfobaculum xiamenense TaxID=995050 RepID=A0A846QN54_9BACT|nr:cation diffusion facilitator family transporter [Desulfobaculum xiamenense]NJB66845.1 cation diffusion facilitator family transporter [Desulfobaculum xiamenense]
MTTQFRAITVSFVAGVCILLFKFAAYALSGSAALLSDALESIINVVASAFAMWSVHVSLTPPDENHPYGHGKIEYFSVLFEGALILLAAAGIVATSVPKVLHPQPLPKLDVAMAISAFASLLNLAVGLYLIRVGKRTATMTLTADGKHLITDVYTTAGVIAGLIVVRVTGYFWIDGAIACVLALHISRTGYDLVRQSIRGLMDEKDAGLVEELYAILADIRRPEWLSVHNVRAWRSGRSIHVDMHLVLPRKLSFEEAQINTHLIESEIRKRIPHVSDILVRTELCDERDCHVCPFGGCDIAGK